MANEISPERTTHSIVLCRRTKETSTVRHAYLSVQAVLVFFMFQPPQVLTLGTQAPKVSTVFGETRPELAVGQILIERHLYVAALDTVSKQPAWVSFTVSKRDWDTDNVLSRNFHTPKELQSFSLEESDYDSSGYDMGHMYGLQFVSASPYASEVNELTVIAAQRPNLNRRVWLQAEDRVKKSSGLRPVNVLTGQLWLKPMPGLVNSNEDHKVASHSFMFLKPGLGDNEEAYLVPQDCDPNSSILSFSIEPKKLRELISAKWVNTLN